MRSASPPAARRRRRLALLLAGAAASVAGCERHADSPADTGLGRQAPAAAAGSGVRRVAVLGGFRTPEAARYDPEQDVYFVSNINGGPSAADSNGYITRIDAAHLARSSVFVAGGRNGAVLHSPKGMAIAGDTLWVADVDAVRGFHRRTGAPLVTVDFRAQEPRFLNDVAIGPDGAVYITDSGIIMNEKGTLHPGPDRIFRVGAGHAITVVAQGDSLQRPNGIAWDAAGGRWIVAGFAPLSSRVYALRPGDPAITAIGSAPGKLDGVVLPGDGRVLASCWTDSSIYAFDVGKGAQGAQGERLITGVPEPAAIGLDTKRNRLLVPLFMNDRVELWQLPTR